MIELKNVTKAYPNGVHALNHVDLSIEDGEFVYVIGATGSGKSTLIKLLNGEEVADEGTVIVNGVDVGHSNTARFQPTEETLAVFFKTIVCCPS